MENAGARDGPRAPALSTDGDGEVAFRRECDGARHAETKMQWPTDSFRLPVQRKPAAGYGDGGVVGPAEYQAAASLRFALSFAPADDDGGNVTWPGFPLTGIVMPTGARHRLSTMYSNIGHAERLRLRTFGSGPYVLRVHSCLLYAIRVPMVAVRLGPSAVL
jgi:hypothetical protein